MTQDDRLLSILIIAQDARALGGVNNFLRILRRKLLGQAQAMRFSNGRRRGEKGTMNAVRRMAWDYARFCVLVRSRHFDVLHINPTLDLKSTPRDLVFPVLSSLLSPRTKSVLFYRGWDWTALDAIKRSFWRLALYKFAHSKIDRILVLSDDFRVALVALGIPPDRIAVVTTMFEGDVIRRVLSKTNIGRPRNNIVFLSRFVSAKGGAELLTAFSRVLRTYPDLKLIMAGSGPCSNSWKRLSDELRLGDAVHFPGYVSGTKKMEYLASSEIMVLPTSHPEGMPNAILEAMASGCAILATPVARIRDVVKHGANGYLIDKRDSDSVEAGLRALLADRNELRRIGMRNHRTAWSNWESQTVTNNILEQYRAALGAHRCP